MLPIDLHIPASWQTQNANIMAWGISADGSHISGTYHIAPPPTDTGQWFTSVKSKQAPFTYSPLSLDNNLASDVTCRGTTNAGDLVGHHVSPTGMNPFLYIASPLLSITSPPPSLVDLSEGSTAAQAYGVSENYILGTINIVGSWTPRGGGSARGTLWRYVPSQPLAIEYPGDKIPPPVPNAAEDVTVYAINSNGDLVVTAVNAKKQKRHFVAIRLIGNISPYHWIQVVEGPSFPVSPDALTILGINKHRVITGWFSTSPSSTSGFYASVGPTGTIQNFHQFDHPSASMGTVFGGVSDTGVIVGTYDSNHPFVCSIPLEPYWLLAYINEIRAVPQRISPEEILPI